MRNCRIFVIAPAPPCLKREEREGRERERERQRDRETERQRDRETERQRDRETERERKVSKRSAKEQQKI